MDDVNEALDGFGSYSVRYAIKGELPLVAKGERVRRVPVVAVGWFGVDWEKCQSEPSVEGLDEITLESYEAAETGVPGGDSRFQVASGLSVEVGGGLALG